VSAVYPPAPAPAPMPGYPRPRGHSGSRFRAPILLAVFGGMLAAILVVALIAVKSSAPPAEQPRCPGGPCGNPPTRAPGNAPALVHGQVFESSGLGYRFEFNQIPGQPQWKIEDQDARDVTLSVGGGAAILSIRGVPAGEASRDALLDQQVDRLKARIPDLQVDDNPDDAILAPSVGFRRGVGDLFGGTFQTPQGAGIPLDVVIMAASDGQATVAMTVLTPKDNRDAVFSLVDAVMNTFRFPSEVQS
jgi:hypothetical protein